MADKRKHREVNQSQNKPKLLLLHPDKIRNKGGKITNNATGLPKIQGITTNNYIPTSWTI